MGAFFVRRPIVAIVIAILMTMAGAVAMTKLPTAQYPDIVPPQIQVTTTYTGADAITIEQSVATPLEQQMNGVDYMIYMQSTNANDGTMKLTVTFDVETDINFDQVNTQNRVSQAQPNLPADVNQFGLTVKKATSNPLLIVSLYSPKGTYDALFLGNLRDDQRQRRHLPRARRGPDPELRDRRLRHAHLGQAGTAGEPRADSPRPHERGEAAEHGQPGRGNRHGARPARARSSPTPCAPRAASRPPRNSATSSCA